MSKVIPKYPSKRRTIAEYVRKPSRDVQLTEKVVQYTVCVCVWSVMVNCTQQVHVGRRYRRRRQMTPLATRSSRANAARRVTSGPSQSP